MQVTVTCAGILNIGYNLRYDTAFPRKTTDVHVLCGVGTNTETYHVRSQNGEHTFC